MTWSSRAVRGTTVAALLLPASPAFAAHFRHEQCASDTTKVESAMASAASLSALNKRVRDDFDRLQTLYRGDARRHLTARRADWLCDVERRCGRYASIEAGLGQCLQNALRLRAQELEGLGRDLQGH